MGAVVVDDVVTAASDRVVVAVSLPFAHAAANNPAPNTKPATRNIAAMLRATPH